MRETVAVVPCQTHKGKSQYVATPSTTSRASTWKSIQQAGQWCGGAGVVGRQLSTCSLLQRKKPTFRSVLQRADSCVFFCGCTKRQELRNLISTGIAESGGDTAAIGAARPDSDCREFITCVSSRRCDGRKGRGRERKREKQDSGWANHR